MKKILLVDDDMATLKGLQMCFGSKNFPTISANIGVQGVQTR